MWYHRKDPESNQRSGQLSNMCSNFAILNGAPPGHHQRTQGNEVVAKAGSSSWHLFLRFGVLPLPRCAAAQLRIVKLEGRWFFGGRKWGDLTM
jgi:hypothetical protein